MKTYWYIHIKDDDGSVAEAPGKKTLVDWAEDIIIQKKIPFEYLISSNEPQLQDYLADDLGIPLMSEKLKNIIDKHLTGKENLQWYDAIVNYKNKKITYYVPKFMNNLDVLNNEKSMFNRKTGSLIKANLLISKIENYSFFPLPELSDSIPFEHRLIVSDEIKKDVIKKKLAGIVFSKVLVS